ncbi:MAG TPA: type I-B CRISPR-associated protein Cas8b1/Cst1 [Methanoregula sp.]|nr:type I-B CRISPR-associated protein Cas8b1/Cst1 [Methanoregula sp.]
MIPSESPVLPGQANAHSSARYPLSLTGDPFVDTGITAIELMTGKSWPDIQEDDFKKAADDLIKLYMTPAWSKDLNSIFPNSSYIQYSPGYDRKEKSREFLFELIDGLNDRQSNSHYCSFCGAPAFTRKDATPFVKAHIPLTGSSKFTNFFPSLRNGVTVCARCVFAIQFIPLVSYKIRGKPCIISSNNPEIVKQIAKETIDEINKKRILGDFQSTDTSGIINEKFRNPQNALFHLAYKVTQKYSIAGITGENEEITLYHFDNKNQNSWGVRIYTLPNNIFKFVGIVMNSPEYKLKWFALLSRYYDKSTKIPDDLPIWKGASNKIYNRLLNDQSILWAFKDDESKTLTVPFVIVERYLKLVKKMSQQRIERIKKLADRIAQSIEESGKVRRVNDLLVARDLPSFRNQLQLIFKDWQKMGHEDPLISFDEYVDVIIPGDYLSWTEVRDLIIIRLYEKLHPMLVKGEKSEPIEEES